MQRLAPASYHQDLLQRCLAAKGRQADPYYRIGAKGARIVLEVDREVFDEQRCMMNYPRAEGCFDRSYD